MKFYTSAYSTKNNILVRGIKDGKPFAEKVKYKPYLFVNTKKEEHTKYKDVHGTPVHRMDFDSMSDAREFVKTYSDVDNMTVYGMTKFTYTYLNDAYRTIDYDPSQISVVGLDIETSKKAGGGFASAEVADAPITAITISRNGFKASFGYKDYVEHKENIKYYRCENEEAMLRAFLTVWNSVEFCPDVVTGWNIEFYDIPFLVNRIERVLGEGASKKLSPWGIINSYEQEIMGRVNKSYELVGIANLDYMQVYKKFILSPRESYALDYICELELGVNKLDYSEYGSLHDLYEQNFQLYMEYNIHDVDLIDMLEAKLKLIEMVFAIAYDAKVNFEDALTSVLLWDVIIHNYLLSFNTVVKPQENNTPEHAIVGGYVKDPHVGLTKWPVSFDLTSLYPHLIMQYGIGPENLVKRMEFSIDEFLALYDAGFLDTTDELLRNTQTFKSLSYAHEHNLSLTANGALYSREKQSFLGELMNRMFIERNEYKGLMMDAKKEYSQTKAPELLNTISKYNNLQQTRKVNLNSAYGACANKYFRWFSTAVAESITTSGQLSIRWIEMKLNRYLNKLLSTTDVDYVVAIDTDSVYIRLDSMAEKFFPDKDTKQTVAMLDKICQEKLQPFITKSYEELASLMNARENKMFMKRENIADKAIWIAKKRYIMNVYDSEGVAYDKPDLKMMGIEAIRSSTPGIVRAAIKKSLDLIMNADETALQQYVVDFEKEFFASPFEVVAFPRGVSDLEKYADKNKVFGFKTPVHVKGSLFFNHLLKKMKLDDKYERISSGDKIKFCYLKEPNIYRTPVISCGAVVPEELDLKRHIDYHTQFEKAYLSPLSNITDAIGWQLVDRPSLMDFFGD
jgi:DNA polymerase elongation subunit (family B)